MILFICSYWALARDNHRILFKECENIISKYFRFEKRRHSQQTEFSSVIFLCLLCAMQRLINRIRWFVKSVRTLLFIDRLNFILERISNIILYVTYEYIFARHDREFCIHVNSHCFSPFHHFSSQTEWIIIYKILSAHESRSKNNKRR